LRDRRSRGDGVRFYKDRTAKLRSKIVEDVATCLEITLKIAVEKDEDLFERSTAEIVEIVSHDVSEKLTESIDDILRKKD
jgi:hypothetical protein